MNKLVFNFFLIFAGISLTKAQTTTDWSGFYAGGNGFVSSDKSNSSAILQINQISGLFVANRGLTCLELLRFMLAGK